MYQIVINWSQEPGGTMKSLWVKAKEQLEEELGRPPTDAEIEECCRDLRADQIDRATELMESRWDNEPGEGV
jgi:hypothetical protein